MPPQHRLCSRQPPPCIKKYHSRRWGGTNLLRLPAIPSLKRQGCNGLRRRLHLEQDGLDEDSGCEGGWIHHGGVATVVLIALVRSNHTVGRGGKEKGIRSHCAMVPTGLPLRTSGRSPAQARRLGATSGLGGCHESRPASMLKILYVFMVSNVVLANTPSCPLRLLP